MCVLSFPDFLCDVLFLPYLQPVKFHLSETFLSHQVRSQFQHPHQAKQYIAAEARCENHNHNQVAPFGTEVISLQLILRGRSEERRVGKECRVMVVTEELRRMEC